MEVQGENMQYADIHGIGARLLVHTALVIVLALAGVLSIVGGTIKVARAAPENTCGPYSCSSYSCGDNQTNHCYAIYRWYGGVSGAQTTLNRVVQLYTPDTGIGFIDDEMWLGALGECSPNCWVEVGETSLPDGSANSTQYFWGDMRPGLGFSQHYFTTIPTGDYGYQANFQIWQTSSSTFTAAIYAETDNYFGYSTANSISPNDIDVGSELAGGGTVIPMASQAPKVQFIDNMWQGSSGYFYYQDYHHYVSGSGALYGNGAPPPFFTVLAVPNGSTNSGGDFETWCC